MKFKSYIHVERINKDDVANIYKHPVIIQPKLDGSNASVYVKDGSIACGSRKRELSTNKDNAHFYNYITTTTDVDVVALREYLLAHPNLYVYGEWLGHAGEQKSFVGSIKQYKDGGFYIFDVFDDDIKDYLPYKDWSAIFSTFYGKIVPVIAEIEHPTEENIAAYTDKCDFNMNDGYHGEGIVVKGRDKMVRDDYLNPVVAKIVRTEFKVDKAKSKRVYLPNELESEYVDKYCTEAFLDKTRNKICQVLGVDELDKNDKKHIGMFLSLVQKDIIEENIYDFVKKRNFPQINFMSVQVMTKNAARDFMGI